MWHYRPGPVDLCDIVDQGQLTYVTLSVSVSQEQVEADVPNHKLWVTSSKSAGQLVEALTKTGKKVLYVGPVSNWPMSSIARLRVSGQYTLSDDA